MGLCPETQWAHPGPLQTSFLCSEGETFLDCPFNSLTNFSRAAWDVIWEMSWRVRLPEWLKTSDDTKIPHLTRQVVGHPLFEDWPYFVYVNRFLLPWNKDECRSREYLLGIRCCLNVCSVTQLCLTLCDPLDCSPPGSSVHGILQARILEWVAISSSRGSSWPRDWTHISYVSCTGRWILYHYATWEAPKCYILLKYTVYYILYKCYILLLRLFYIS